jgi:hypothetical protein
VNKDIIPLKLELLNLVKVIVCWGINIDYPKTGWYFRFDIGTQVPVEDFEYQ